MRIKEVEQRVGIGRANIRYYEKEGLLTPTRDNENNYREYTEEDVRQLQRIKVLRLLGVSPSDIKLLSAENISLEEVMKKRLEQLENEAKEIQNLQKICETIIERDIDIRSLNEDVLTGDKEKWQVRLEEILKHDMVAEVITKKQVNLHLMISLLYGYFVNAVVSFLFADFFLNYTRVKDPSEMNGSDVTYGGGYIFPPSIALYIMMILAILCFIGIYFQASVKWHVVIFHVSAIITTPLVIELSRMYTDSGFAKVKGILLLRKFTGVQISVFWLMVMIYVAALYLLSIFWDKLFTKVRYVLPVAAFFTIIYTIIAFFLTEELAIPGIAFLIMTFFIGISWTTTIMDREIYNRYYVVIAAVKIMNVIGTGFSQRGRGLSTAWLK